MAHMSDYLANQLRAHIFRTASFTKPTALYVSLHCGSPGETGVNEVTTTNTGYTRVARAPLDANWTAEATAGLTANAAAIDFPTPTGNWNTTDGTSPAVQITYAGVWDGSGANNFLFGIPLTNGKTVNNGDPAPSFPIGDFEMQFS